MRDYLEIGSAPYDEDCAQVGDENYSKEAKIQVSAYLRQLKRMFPEQFKTGIEAKTRSNPHDFGTYYEAAIYFDENNEAQVEAAFHIENNHPQYWDKEALEEMTSKGLTPSTNNEEIAKEAIEARMAEIKKKYPLLFANKWEKASNYAGTEYWDYFGVIGQHRDSNTVDRSNYEVAKNMLQEAKEKAIKEGLEEGEDSWIEDTHSGHWAVGWVDHLLIHFSAPDVILQEAEEILKALEQYPVLDDSHLSELEHDELHETWLNNRDDFGKEVVKVLRKAMPDIQDYRDMSDKEQEMIDNFTGRILDYSSAYSGLENAWVSEDDIERYFQGDGKYEAKDFQDNEFFQTLLNIYSPEVKPIRKNPAPTNNDEEENYMHYFYEENPSLSKDKKRLLEIWARLHNLGYDLTMGYDPRSAYTLVRMPEDKNEKLEKEFHKIAEKFSEKELRELFFGTSNVIGPYELSMEILNKAPELSLNELIDGVRIEVYAPATTKLSSSDIKEVKKAFDDFKKIGKRNPSPKYLATAHISNVGGIGIIKIEHDGPDEIVHWEIVSGDKVVASGKSDLYYDRSGIPDDVDYIDEDDEGPFFDAHGSTWTLQEFMRNPVKRNPDNDDEDYDYDELKRYDVSWHTAIGPASTYYEGTMKNLSAKNKEDAAKIARRKIARSGAWSETHIVITSVKES